MATLKDAEASELTRRATDTGREAVAEAALVASNAIETAAVSHNIAAGTALLPDEQAVLDRASAAADNELDAAVAAGDVAAVRTAAAKLVAAAQAVAAHAVAAAARARADRDAAHVHLFFLQLRAGLHSLPTADTSSQSGRPRPATHRDVDTLLSNLPVLSVADVSDRWRAFREQAQLAATARNERVPLIATIKRVLTAAAMHRASSDLRLHCNIVLPDEASTPYVLPAFAFTQSTDAACTPLGALILVKVAQHPDRIRHAVAELIIYARRRILKLCEEARKRNDLSALHDMFMLAIATDGRHVVFCRVDSGAPEAGASFQDARLFPWVQTSRLELLPELDVMPLPEEPPAGFAALVRVLQAPLQCFCPATPPLQSLNVRWCPPDLWGSTSGEHAYIELGHRLGSGGSCDVYAIGDHHVLKMTRCATEGRIEMMTDEATALKQLEQVANEGLVPRLVSVGVRDMAGATTSLPYPVLLLSPQATPLGVWLSHQLEAVDDAATRAALRLQLANSVVSRILGALKLSHERNVIHCDVRPANIVVTADGAAVLVDWGLARAPMVPCTGCGVVAYAAPAVFLHRDCVAEPQIDVYAAALTWLCIAYGNLDATAPC